MATEWILIVEIINFASQIVGKKCKVKVNSNIYARFAEIVDGDDDQDEIIKKFCPTKDIYKITGCDESPITMDDVLNIFEKMQSQLNKLEKEDNGIKQHYYYEGIKYHKKKKLWEIYWCT